MRCLEIQSFQERLIIFHLLREVELRVTTDPRFHIDAQDRPEVDRVGSLVRDFFLLNYESDLLHKLVGRASLLVLAAWTGAVNELIVEVLNLLVSHLPLLFLRFLDELGVCLELRVGGVVDLLHDLGDVWPQQGFIVYEVGLRCRVFLFHQLYGHVYLFLFGQGLVD